MHDAALFQSQLACKRWRILPAVFYFHPWEVDPAQPRIAGISAKTRFRHYVNIDRMEQRLNRLLADFEWGRMDELFLEPLGSVDGN